MTKHQQQQASLVLLKEQLKTALQLDLDDFDLEANLQHEYVSKFVGISLKSSFQAIYDVNKGDLHGFEANLLASLGDIQSTTPDFAYSYAKATGKLVKFDRVVRTLHLLNYKQIFQEKGLLFLSVHPDLLISVNEHGKVFEHILHEYSLPTERVVIQIRDYSTTEENENLVTYERQLAAAIDNYHDRGFKIGVDFFGNKHSLVSRLWKLSPDYIKFDPNLIQEAEIEPRLQIAIKGIVHLVEELGALPIISNVKTQSQLEIAVKSGASLVQGDYLGQASTVSKLHDSDFIQKRFVAN